MSDYVPNEILMKIMKRLPVKSLLRFRCVSEQWKSLINSSEFMATYNLNQFQRQQRLLVGYKDPVSTEYNFCSLVDNETLALQNFSMSMTVPVLLKQFQDSPPVVGSSQGLLCLYGNSIQDSGYNGMVILWNPSIRKSVGIAVNGNVGWTSFGKTVVGFGVCPTTNDPTIVKFTHADCISPYVPWVVEVFSLSSGSWRNIPSTNPFYGTITVGWGQVATHKFIYLQSFYSIPERNVIISYDMTTEETGVIELPDCLAQQRPFTLSISKVCESLAVLEYSRNTNTNTQVCVVWTMMDADVPNLFTKLFTINTPYLDLRTRFRTLGFTKSGEPILARLGDDEKQVAIVVYEPGSKLIKDIGIYGRSDSFFVGSYMDTLLLHDQLDGRVYSNIN